MNEPDVRQRKVEGPEADRYDRSASDGVETFVIRQPSPRTVIPSLEIVGRELDDARARITLDADQGPTKTYNAMKDPACDAPRFVERRRLHEAIHGGGLEAYRRADIAVLPHCPVSDANRAAVQVFDHEVIGRLYVVNTERAWQEERMRMGAGTNKGNGATKGNGGGEGAEPAKVKRKAEAKVGSGGDEGHRQRGPF